MSLIDTSSFTVLADTYRPFQGCAGVLLPLNYGFTSSVAATTAGHLVVDSGSVAYPSTLLCQTELSSMSLAAFGAQAFAEELQLAAGVRPHSVKQAQTKGAHGSAQHEAELEEGAAKVAGGLAKLERDMLNKITKPLGAQRTRTTLLNSRWCKLLRHGWDSSCSMRDDGRARETSVQKVASIGCPSMHPLIW